MTFFINLIRREQHNSLIHTGSRGLSQHLYQHYHHLAGHTGLTRENKHHYLQDHNAAYQFGMTNRHVFAQHMSRQLKTECQLLLNIAHNFVEQHDNDHYLHRKGASPSHQGWVIIAGSRGHFSYLVKPKTTIDTLYSIAHGTGRKWQYTEWKGRLSHCYTHWQAMQKTELNSLVMCKSKQLLYEKTPQAYKSIETVIACLLSHSLIDVIARFHPIITNKTPES